MFRIKKILSGVLAFVMAFSFSIPSFANDVNTYTSNEDNAQLISILSKVEGYIDLEGNKLFDDEQAKLNNESNEIILIGLTYNEMLRAEQQGNYKEVNRMKRAAIGDLIRYGNWCGPKNKGETTKDLLDAQCKKHDICYQKQGMWDTDCDIKFVHNIARNFGKISKISPRAKTYALAAVMIFSNKVGGTIQLKKLFPRLAPYLP